MGPNGKLVEHQKEPENLESPPSIFEQFITSPEVFYVRNHFEVPHLDASAWRLKIEGAVQRPFEVGYDELLSMDSRAVVATLECSGNSRVFLPKRSKGVQWGLGAVGTAEWSGIPLAALLTKAGIAHDAAYVILEGADSGHIDEEPRTPGTIHFSHSLPVDKALDLDVLLAHRMNEKPLPQEHGFPVRALVPGWYGMASVKWLQRIQVTRGTFAGYFQTFEYSRWERHAGIPTLVPLTRGEVKAEIAQPEAGERIPSNTTYRVHGAAWAGESEIAKVELSVDGGVNWRRTRLLDIPRPYCWVRWEHQWQTPAQPGPITLMARATDKHGRYQPFAHDEDDRHYAVHHVLPVRVYVQ
jgi:DMSO/TMAO reductase YedYZ molybdopterin-dependent catalytic subunit